jgi:hypothetical protein
VARRCCDERPELRPTIGAVEKMLGRLRVPGRTSRSTVKLALGAACAAVLVVAAAGAKYRSPVRVADSPPAAPPSTKLEAAVAPRPTLEAPRERAPAFEAKSPVRADVQKARAKRSPPVHTSPLPAAPEVAASNGSHQAAPATAPLVPPSQDVNAPIRRLDRLMGAGGAPGALTLQRRDRELVNPFPDRR